jgi:hypothetical protein
VPAASAEDQQKRPSGERSAERLTPIGRCSHADCTVSARERLEVYLSRPEEAQRIDVLLTLLHTEMEAGFRSTMRPDNLKQTQELPGGNMVAAVNRCRYRLVCRPEQAMVDDDYASSRDRSRERNGAFPDRTNRVAKCGRQIDTAVTRGPGLARWLEPTDNRRSRIDGPMPLAAHTIRVAS